MKLGGNISFKMSYMLVCFDKKSIINSKATKVEAAAGTLHRERRRASVRERGYREIARNVRSNICKVI